MTKLEQLKKMLREWKPSRSITVAYEICDFLYNNLDMGNEDEAQKKHEKEGEKDEKD